MILYLETYDEFLQKRTTSFSLLTASFTAVKSHVVFESTQSPDQLNLEIRVGATSEERRCGPKIIFKDDKKQLVTVSLQESDNKILYGVIRNAFSVLEPTQDTYYDYISPLTEKELHFICTAKGLQVRYYYDNDSSFYEMDEDNIRILRRNAMLMYNTVVDNKKFKKEVAALYKEEEDKQKEKELQRQRKEEEARERERAKKAQELKEKEEREAREKKEREAAEARQTIIISIVVGFVMLILLLIGIDALI